MANELDELSNDVMEEGLDANVIAKKIPIKVGVGSKVFEFFLWFPLIIPGLIFLIMKVKAENHLRKLQQRINVNASEIDNYLEQRVVILKNCAKLLDKAIDLDKDTFTKIASYRAGGQPSDSERNEIASQMDNVANKINIAFERYPDLQAHNEIADAMQQNNYLQREITAARTVYNDSINQWNADISSWPTKMIVAAKHGYTTRIPFIASKEIKEQAKDVLF